MYAGVASLARLNRAMFAAVAFDFKLTRYRILRITAFACARSPTRRGALGSSSVTEIDRVSVDLA